jgi:hypothetical protein
MTLAAAVVETPRNFLLLIAMVLPPFSTRLADTGEFVVYSPHAALRYKPLTRRDLLHKDHLHIASLS